MSREIALTQNQIAIVDDNLFEYLNQWKWSVDGSGYPQRMIKTEKGWRPCKMYSYILPPVPGKFVDHKNLNRLDNRKKNLRYATYSESARNRGVNKNNTTGYKGVHFNASRNIFQAFITVDRRHIYLGQFSIAHEAAEAYNQAALLW